MRLIFAGTPMFAAQTLRSLLDAGHDIPLVLTQPDRPAGRGMKLMASEVKQVAVLEGIEVFQPASLKTPDAQDTLVRAKAELMVVAAYGLILPKSVLHSFPYGCVNIHASLLPRWRGAAPIQRAIWAGDCESGVCIMQMDEGLDTGPVILSKVISLAARETAATLHDKLTTLGAQLIVEALRQVQDHTATATPQPDFGITYAHKLTKAEARIDWTQPCARIDAQVRALNPVPVCFTALDGEVLRIWQATPLTGTHSDALPGTVVAASAQGVDVVCGEGTLRIEQLQRPGGKAQTAEAFLRGRALVPGTVLGT